MTNTELEPEFRRYADKPEAQLLGYTTVRGAELRAVDAVLTGTDDVSVSDFENRFARPETQDGITSRNTDHVVECLRFLQAIDYVEITPQNTVSRYNEDAFSGAPFEVRLLYHVRQQRRANRQLTYVSEVLTRMDQKRVTVERLLEEVRGDDAGEFGISWNEDKLRMWANLFDPLGAIAYSTEIGQEVFASPSRALLAELLGSYAESADCSPDNVTAADALAWIDETFLPVFAEHAGTPRVSVAVADTLRSLADDGVIESHRQSDAQNVVQVPQAGRSIRTISHLSFGDVPTGPAYRHPLERFERGGTQ